MTTRGVDVGNCRAVALLKDGEPLEIIRYADAARRGEASPGRYADRSTVRFAKKVVFCSVSVIARQVGVDRKTVRTHIAKGLEPPAYKRRAPAPSIIDRFEPYLRERLAAYPALTARPAWPDGSTHICRTSSRWTPRSASLRWGKYWPDTASRRFSTPTKQPVHRRRLHRRSGAPLPRPNGRLARRRDPDRRWTCGQRRRVDYRPTGGAESTAHRILGGLIKDNQQTAFQLNRRQKWSRWAGPLQS
jgi:hypothetical protein